MAEPYRDTSVSVERSRSEIRGALMEGGAKAVQFEEDFEDLTLTVRFIWKGMTIRFRAKQLPPIQGPRGGWKVSPEQRERQAWRGMAWYITSMVKAATFGLFEFEDVFMSFFETSEGETIGERMRPMIEQGRLALPKGR